MNRTQQALVALAMVVGGLSVAGPAQATVESRCPTPTKAEVALAKDDAVEHPPRGVKAIKGVRVRHIPKGLFWGKVDVHKHDGMAEYGYFWSDNRDDVDRKHRMLWVRVACWPKVTKLAQLKKAPFIEGTFTGDIQRKKIGGRTVLTKVGDGALGHGRYLGWVEREGVVITVMASEPLVAELDEIVKGIKLT